MSDEVFTIYISHSRKVGEEVAECLSRLFKAFFEQRVEIILSSDKTNFGVSSIQKSRKNLEKCDLLVFIDDEDARKSSLCSFELGYFCSLCQVEADEEVKEEKLLHRVWPLQPLPLKATAGLTELNNHPIAELGSEEMNRKTLGKLFQSVSEQITPQLEWETLRWKFDDDWQKFNYELGNSLHHYVALRSSLNHLEYDEDFRKMVLSDVDKIYALKSEMLHQLDIDLTICISNIISRNSINFREPHLKSLDDLFITYPFRLLLNILNTVNGAKGDVISVTDRNFFKTIWLDELSRNVRRSMWTTNTNGTNGRIYEKKYIEQQERIITGGVSITRLFIVQENITSEEAAELKRVILALSEIGVRTGCILMEEMNDYKQKLITDIGGSLDFMLLDDEYVYITHAEDKKDGVQRLELCRNFQAERVRQAIKFIENESTAEFFENKSIAERSSSSSSEDLMYISEQIESYFKEKVEPICLSE